jgi:hypothetical protein
MADGRAVIGRSPMCLTCNDTGAVKGPGGVDACPDCALAAEQDFRIASEASEQTKATKASRVRRGGKPMGKAA